MRQLLFFNEQYIHLTYIARKNLNHNHKKEPSTIGPKQKI